MFFAFFSNLYLNHLLKLSFCFSHASDKILEGTCPLQTEAGKIWGYLPQGPKGCSLCTADVHCEVFNAGIEEFACRSNVRCAGQSENISKVLSDTYGNWPPLL